jgi:peptidoglycan LD-endopeptidase LytH
VIGYVGNTGNARGTAPHLHYGIYGRHGAENPFLRLAPSAHDARLTAD